MASGATAPTPFQNDVYTGNIELHVYKDPGTAASFVRIIGERILIESFQGRFSSDLKKIFGEEVVVSRNESVDLTAIFCNCTGMATYASQAETPDQVQNRLEKDAIRTINGDLFNGYAIIDKTNGGIIGRISVGSGYEPGESQSGLIIREDYRGNAFGKESICLIATLACFLTVNQCQVGDTEKAPVHRFTATALDTNERSIHLITKIGLKYMRPLTQSENYSTEPRSLYGISIEQIRPQLERLIQPDKFTYTTTPYRELDSSSGLH